MAASKPLLAVAAALAAALPWPARAEVIRHEEQLSGRTLCWWSGSDTEQYNRDHSYVYSFHPQAVYPGSDILVVRGVWAMAPDGMVTIKLDGDRTLQRKYVLRFNRLTETTGTLDGGQEGYFC